MNKIHAVWLGGNMTPLTLVCIDDWRKQGYEVALWTDKDPIIVDWIEGCSFARNCYKRGLMAFVVDYLRLKVLQAEGGLYLDTDVTIRKDPFLLFGDSQFSVGSENEFQFGNAVIYAQPSSSLLGQIINFYESEIMGSNLYMGPDILTKFIRSYNGSDSLITFPVDYFYGYSGDGNEFFPTENTHLIHWFQHTWKNPKRLVWLKGKNKGIIGRFYIWQKYFFRF